VQQLTIRILLASLLIVIAAPGGALAQADTGWPVGVGDAPHGVPALVLDASQPASQVPPPSSTRQFQRRFDVVEVPEQFDQVLQIVDFPAGAWTPLHTPGGRVYTTVIDGAISTRLPWTDGVYETTYESGDTFVERPGEYMQVGNATTGTTRVMATALLPPNAPLTIYQDGFTSPAYPTLRDWNYTHDLSGPTTTYRSVTEVDRPGGAFELVQLVLDLTALSPLLSSPEEEPRESCSLAWTRMSVDMLSAGAHQFERVAANLCVSSGYVPGPVAPSDPTSW
jgi:quercetin dioxygenase-like cupin family protein